MYRYRRRRKLQRRRRATVVAVSAAVLAFVVGIPTLAAADPVNDVLNNLGLGSGSGDGSTSGGGSVTPSAGTPPSYTPPLHGTNPHGQGSAAVVDLNPSDTNPYPGQPDGSEELIVGDSRGEQTSDGSYHGNVALAYLFGNAILGIETAPGESEDGPLQPIQDGLDQLCDQSNGQICVSLLEMHSSTTSNSSTNSFRAVGAHVGGEEGVNADVATSNGNISSDGTCQTAHGDSSVADASVGGALFADAAQGSSTSTSCNNGTQSVDQKSTVIGIGGVDPPPGVPLPTAGCENGTPNTNFTALAPILGAVCNADDTNGSQTSAPYGVREALTLFALITDGSSVLKATAAGPESHAVAPAAQVTTPPTGPGTTAPGGGTKGAGGKGGGGAGGAGGGAGGAGDGGAGAGAAAGAAAAGDGQLAFTGADLLALGMVGGALILGGLALTATAGRRHRQTV